MTWTPCDCGRVGCTESPLVAGTRSAFAAPLDEGGSAAWSVFDAGRLVAAGTADTLALAQAAAEAALNPLATVPTPDLMAELVRRGLDVVEPVRADVRGAA